MSRFIPDFDVQCVFFLNLHMKGVVCNFKTASKVLNFPLFECLRKATGPESTEFLTDVMLTVVLMYYCQVILYVHTAVKSDLKLIQNSNSIKFRPLLNVGVNCMYQTFLCPR